MDLFSLSLWDCNVDIVLMLVDTVLEGPRLEDAACCCSDVAPTGPARLPPAPLQLLLQVCFILVLVAGRSTALQRKHTPRWSLYPPAP